MSDLLAGFRVQATIGKGAGSIIYRVADVRSGQLFVLKRVVRRSRSDRRFMEQAEREFRVTHQIDHPNLRRSFALHRKRRWLMLRELLLIAEYVEGSTLEQSCPSELDELLEICGKVCQGLHALHQAGYVHADIKPHNILWGSEGVVKVIDFGQSCRMGHRKQRIQGTPDYIAPEQVRRLPLDQRTDVFNLGATMYWALTRRAYPTDLSPTSFGRGHSVTTAVAPPTPREIDETIPRALSDLVMDCCRPNPIDRPSDMPAVFKRIQAAAAAHRRVQKSTGSMKSPTNGEIADSIVQPPGGSVGP